MAGSRRIPTPVVVVSYRVHLYVDQGDGESVCVRTEQCHDHSGALVFAVQLLLGIYMRLVYPGRDESGRRFWAELTPLRLVHGRWEPDPAAGGTVDSVFLDGETGEIILDLAASMRLWQPPRPVTPGLTTTSTAGRPHPHQHPLSPPLRSRTGCVGGRPG